jgi:hypothetical protein
MMTEKTVMMTEKTVTATKKAVTTEASLKDWLHKTLLKDWLCISIRILLKDWLCISMRTSLKDWLHTSIRISFTKSSFLHTLFFSSTWNFSPFCLLTFLSSYLLTFLSLYLFITVQSDNLTTWWSDNLIHLIHNKLPWLFSLITYFLTYYSKVF